MSSLPTAIVQSIAGAGVASERVGSRPGSRRAVAQAAGRQADEVDVLVASPDALEKSKDANDHREGREHRQGTKHHPPAQPPAAKPERTVLDVQG